MEEIRKIMNITDDNLLNQITAISGRVHFEKNDILLNIGDSQDYIYLIVKGIVRSYYLDFDGNDITKTFMKENDFCVGESLFEEEGSIQCFEALEPVEAIKIRARDFKKIILADDGLTKVYIDFLEKNLIYKMQRESMFQILSAKERYLHFHKMFSSIEKRVNQSYIASYLGIAPESLSRIKRMIKGK